jgi:hypothetical protein
LLNAKDTLNLKVYTVLTHTSISSLSPPFDLNGFEEEEIRNKRSMWQAYIREFSVFYLDLFVEYIQALILQGSYTIEDAQVFREVIGNHLSLSLLIFRSVFFVGRLRRLAIHVGWLDASRCHVSHDSQLLSL